jgi:hypothetical protein
MLGRVEEVGVVMFWEECVRRGKGAEGSRGEAIVDIVIATQWGVHRQEKWCLDDWARRVSCLVKWKSDDAGGRIVDVVKLG